MERSKKLPKFDSLDALVDSFDNDDWGDYMEDMPEVDIEVDIKRTRHIFVLEDELSRTLTRIAAREKTTAQELISTWLREKVNEREHIAV